jgi:hypothetical protein
MDITYDQSHSLSGESGDSIYLRSEAASYYSYADTTSESFYPQFLKDQAERLIKDIIRARDEDEIASIETELYSMLAGHEQALSDITLDKVYLINVRAMAARLFLAKIAKPGTSLNRAVFEPLLKNQSPLIRLGVVWGLADAGDWDAVRSFTNDSHMAVAEEARDLLADAEA